VARRADRPNPARGLLGQVLDPLVERPAVVGDDLRAGAALIDDILVMTGPDDAIALLSCVAPGDHVVVHAPGYQPFAALARWRGCAVSPWYAREEAGWALDLDELTGLLTPRTRLIVVIMPPNPTGYAMPAGEFADLLRLAEGREQADDTLYVPDGAGGERQVKHYYAAESTGIAVGFLLASLHQAGLVALTPGPSSRRSSAPPGRRGCWPRARATGPRGSAPSFAARPHAGRSGSSWSPPTRHTSRSRP